jgi:ElaB/YqjD/DUF883 family membrane-anchored ribosome-binding protein
MSVRSNGGCGRLSNAWSAPAGASPHAPSTRRDHLGEAIASALSSIADRFRGDAGSMTDATKIGAAAAKVGNEALRRLSREVQHRPLVTLAVAVGVGILMGLANHRR